jgi:Response regulators consisting of a CheY-like receiver domain and a winged-helix DNA-binding domain
MKVLIIEDDASLSEIMSKFLKDQRYIVENANTYFSASEKIGVYDYDCILLDIMLPDGNGLNLLEQLNKLNKQDKVIIISAKDSVEDRVTGLELGADDYLVKPFHLSELHARIKSVLRRNNNNPKIIELGNIKIFTDKFSVTINNTPLDLSKKEYDLLHFFLTHHGHIVSKEQIAEAVWGDYIDQADNFDFIYAQIKNLRHKMEKADSDIVIKAVYGFGYKTIEKQ